MGSKRFTESYILAEVAVELARRGGDADVHHDQGLGGTALVLSRPRRGLDRRLPRVHGHDRRGDPPPGAAPGRSRGDPRRAALARRASASSEPLGFENTYALAVVRAVAERDHQIGRVSDVAGRREARIGVSHEFLGRRATAGPASPRAYGLASLRAPRASITGSPTRRSSTARSTSSTSTRPTPRSNATGSPSSPTIATSSRRIKRCSSIARDSPTSAPRRRSPRSSRSRARSTRRG